MVTWIPSIYPIYVSIFLPAPWIRHGLWLVMILLPAAGLRRLRRRRHDRTGRICRELRRLGRIWQDLDDSSENHGCTRPGKPGKSLRTWKWRRNVVDIPWFSHENSMVDLSIVFCQRLPEGKHQNISISNWIGDQKICKFATGQSKHE